jgi:MFS transporter, MHS family, proline/betaine transporter
VKEINSKQLLYSQPVKRQKSIIPLLKIGLVANIFEHYEISIYTYMAAILGQLFFAFSDTTEAVLKALLASSLSYVVKPLGGLYFGWLGDRYGRRFALKYSLIMVALPAALIGLLPTWQTGGFLASGLLISLRMMQGFASGGEGPITASYVFESSPPHYRNLLCNVVHVSALLGILVASAVSNCLFYYFSKEEILTGAWRIPFLIGLLLIGGIAWIRRLIVEPELQGFSPDKFTSSNSLVSQQTAKNLSQPPFFSVTSSLQLLAAFMVLAFFLIAAHTVFSGWFSFYLSRALHYPQEITSITHTLTVLMRVILCLIVGYLSRFIQVNYFVMLSLLLTLSFTFPLFLLLESTPSFLVALTVQLLFVVFLSGLDGTFVWILATLFPRASRCRGMSWTYTGLSTILAATTHSLCFYMATKGGIPLFPAFYIVFSGLLALPAAIYLFCRKNTSIFSL